MFFTLLLMAALLSVGAVFPQGSAERQEETSLLQYTGEPVRIPFQCTNNDILSFGMTCSAEVPCPVYLELAAVAPAGARLFLAGNLHSDTSTMYSVLLVSDDGGRTWSEPHKRLRGAVLKLVHFFDSETGWVSGHSLEPPPRNPFFLLTTDGGQYWRLRPVFDDTRTGMIDEFWFDTARSGGLLIDRLRAGEAGGRYEHHETMTGGESWMIREISSTPIRPRNAIPAAPHPDWRLSADPETKTWCIERRQPGEWITVAAFLIEAGRCIPEEEVLPEPVPEPGPEEAPPAPGGVFRIPGPETPRETPTPGAPPAPKESPTLKKPEL